jgi:hypothetical protein
MYLLFVAMMLLLSGTNAGPAPADPRVCLTNVLMTFFSETDPALLWSEPSNPTSWWECGNCLEVVSNGQLAGLGMPLDVLPPVVYDRSVNGTPWSPDYSNNFFSITSIDDSLWWSIALLRVHTRTPRFPYDTSRFFESAVYVWNSVLRCAWDDVFGGGVWWTDDHTHGPSGHGYKNAITNELFLFASTSLYKATGNITYLEWAQREVKWFLQSGMINADFLVNDGLNQFGRNNNGTTWSYNQGVILGGLVDLYDITGDMTFLALAMNISRAAMHNLVDHNGVFSEVCDGRQPNAPPCVLNEDARIFKGIFARYVGHLLPALLPIVQEKIVHSGLSSIQARAGLSDIAQFIRLNLDYVTADPRNAATWATCGMTPMPRPSPGAVWQSARETVLAGYTSTLSTLDLAIVHAMLESIGLDELQS